VVEVLFLAFCISWYWSRYYNRLSNILLVIGGAFWDWVRGKKKV